MIYVVAVIIIVAGIAAYFYVQNHGFSSMIWKEVDRIAEGSPVHPEPVRDAESLPEPLRRYLRYANPGDRAPAGFARLRHGGRFKIKPGAEWLDIRGEEYFLCSAPALIWSGRVKQNALVWIRARDKYIDRTGNMLIKVRGALTLGDVRGREMDISTLLRYLSEMPWYPTAFLTVPGMQFEEIDAHTVGVIMTDGSYTVTGRFTVNDEGAITRFYTEDRYREEDGKQVQSPWYGTYDDYRDVDELRVPHHVEVFWQLPEGEFQYVDFHITEIQYDIPAPF